MDPRIKPESMEITVEEGAELVLELPESSTQSDIIMEGDMSLAPVIIEELEESEMLDVNMSEFVEARALKIHEVQENVTIGENDQLDLQDLQLDISDMEEPELITAEDEDLLMRQFLNGDLTFSEFSSRIDSSIDLEGTEMESSRNVRENETEDNNEKEERLAPKKSPNVPARKKKKKRILPPALQGLMGEANLRFARGEVDLAVQMCMEIIRQVPRAPEPYQTLAMIYENDQPEKSLQSSLIAAHLSPKDADQWLRLANLSVEADDIKQAITCYSKAIQASPTDVTLYEERAKLQEQMGDKRAYLKGYIKMINQLGPEDGQHIVNYAKLLAQKLMQEENNEQALEAMDHIFTKCPEMVTLEEVNIMTELLIDLKHFHRCLDILTTYTSVCVIYNSETYSKEIESCKMPDDVVVDLKAKFLITLIFLNLVSMADLHLTKFLEIEDPEISGDLYLDIAEALMRKKEYERALILLQPLVDSKNYSLAAVWLRHAECWIGCKNVKSAIESYENVRKLSPQHLGARIELAKLYKLTGNHEEAIDILNQDPEIDVLDSGILYRRAMLLLKVERYDEFLEAGKLLLTRHCVNLRSRTELSSLTKTNGVRQRRDALQLYRLSLGETLEDENAAIFSKDNDITIKKEFSLLLRMCKVAFKLKKYGSLQRICFSALTSKKFEKKNSHIIFLCLVSCIHNLDSFYGYNLVRDLVRVCKRSNSGNLLNIIIQRAEDTRHNKFIMRLLGREDAFSYLQILHANNCLTSGTYKYALNDYVSLFKAEPSALLALLIAVTFMQIGCQKLSSKKHQLVCQALAFFKKYMQIRGTEAKQESDYNMGRAFHQLGLLSGAIHHYKLVLESPQSKLVSQDPDRLDLKREAAFNLHLIYLQSGNPDLARTYLEDYIIV